MFSRIPLLEHYDTRIEDISYVIVWFRVVNEDGVLEPRWTTFIGIANLWFMVTSSFVCVIFFGIKCYTKITKALKHSKMSSYYARSIQKQLFQALVLQTLVPVVLMYVPFGVLYMFPMLNIEVGFISTFVTATIEVIQRIPLLESYDTRIEDISYIIIWFHITNDEGILEPRWITFIGMANLWFMVTSSFVCVIFFGIKCYRKITKALKNSKMSSYYARSIQKQLFQALVLQTLVPVVLMYGPVGILYMFPMLNIEVGFISTFVTATVEVYPAVDPLPTMFIVENFRKTILCGCRNSIKKEEVSELQNRSKTVL
ncbi:unnamed protein product [Caenorhabditis nigoni]